MSPTPAFVDPRDTHMNRSLLVPATILACLLGGALATGCDKKDSSGGPAQALSAKPDPAASAPAQRAAPLKVTGSYEAKAGDVRTPMDAPTFSNVATGALGKGELSLVLPAGDDGAVTGKASGPLGAESFSGMLEDGRLTGTLAPSDGDREAMTGTVMGTVAGKGEGRTAEGSIRVSSPDGRSVREADFKLAPKK